MKERKLLIIGHPEFSTHSNHNKNIFYLLNQEKIDQILLLEQEFNADTNSFNYERSIKAIKDNDHIIFLHPVWWYSVPWTMKLWMDTVLLNFYNENKDSQLSKKKVSIIVTCGKSEEYYNSKKIDHILLPLLETYKYLGWNVDKIFPLYDALNRTEEEQIQFANLLNDHLFV